MSLLALEHIMVSVVGHQIELGATLWTYHSAWQAAHIMRGKESHKGKSHFIPVVVEWPTDELASVILIVLTHPLSLSHG